MGMIKVFNSAYWGESKYIPFDEVKIHSQDICEFTARPYIMFEHADYPLGMLKAEFRKDTWECDLC